MAYIKNIVMENARILFRNFSGKPSKFNAKGKRTFCLVISPETADRLSEEGWNVKFLKPREEGDSPTPYIQVNVGFKDDSSKSPKIYMVTRKKKTLLTEETIGVLDFAEIDNVDVIVTPYKWDVNGNQGVSAYLKTMYVSVIEEDFGGKYDFDEEGDNNEEDLPW